MNCPYYPKDSGIKSHLNSLSESICSLSSKYDNLILLGDFNSYMEEPPMKTFREILKLWDFKKERTCFKNPDNPTCFDIIFKNKSLSFKNTYVIEAGLSDFHGVIEGVMKMHFLKWNHRLLVIGNIRTFLDSLRYELNEQRQFLNEKGLDAFLTICIGIFDEHTL